MLSNRGEFKNGAGIYDKGEQENGDRAKLSKTTNIEPKSLDQKLKTLQSPATAEEGESISSTSNRSGLASGERTCLRDESSAHCSSSTAGSSGSVERRPSISSLSARQSFSVSNLLTLARESPSAATRRLALDYYIKKKIVEREGCSSSECACCFEHSFNGANLLDELNDCLGGRPQFATSTTDSSSSLSLATGERLDLKRFKSSLRQQGYLGRVASSENLSNENDCLFIDGSVAERCGHESESRTWTNRVLTNCEIFGKISQTFDLRKKQKTELGEQGIITGRFGGRRNRKRRRRRNLKISLYQKQIQNNFDEFTNSQANRDKNNNNNNNNRVEANARRSLDEGGEFASLALRLEKGASYFEAAARESGESNEADVESDCNCCSSELEESIGGQEVGSVLIESRSESIVVVDEQVSPSRRRHQPSLLVGGSLQQSFAATESSPSLAAQHFHNSTRESARKSTGSAVVAVSASLQSLSKENCCCLTDDSASNCKCNFGLEIERANEEENRLPPERAKAAALLVGEETLVCVSEIEASEAEASAANLTFGLDCPDLDEFDASDAERAIAYESPSLLLFDSHREKAGGSRAGARADLNLHSGSPSYEPLDNDSNNNNDARYQDERQNFYSLTRPFSREANESSAASSNPDNEEDEDDAHKQFNQNLAPNLDSILRSLVAATGNGRSSASFHSSFEASEQFEKLAELNNSSPTSLRGDERESDNLSSDCGPAASMRRSAKEIAKVSIPSLSSLQYLPTDQMDLVLNRRGGKSERRSSKSSPAKNESVVMKKKSYVSSQESIDRIKCQDSIIHRLCACNCISSSASSGASSSKRNQDRSAKATISKSHSLRSFKLNSGLEEEREREAQRRVSKSVTPTKQLERDDDFGPKERVSSVKRTRRDLLGEKQSPSFFNLLRETRTRDFSPIPKIKVHKLRENREAALDSSGIGDSRAKEKTKTTSSEGRQSPANSGSRAGSKGATSGSSEPSSPLGEEVCSLLEQQANNCKSKCRKSGSMHEGASDGSTRFNGNHKNAHRRLDKQLQKLSNGLVVDSCFERNYGDDGPKSASSNETDFAAREQKRSSSYRRFLSPIRLISSSPSKKQRPTNSTDHNSDSDARNAKQQSFLTRSLNRLSKRSLALRGLASSPSSSSPEPKKPRQDANKLVDEKVDATAEQLSIEQQHCNSPTISISSSTIDRSPLEESSNESELNKQESLNSLEELKTIRVLSRKKNRSRLSVGPEVKLNALQARPTNKSDNCDNMTRIGGEHSKPLGKQAGYLDSNYPSSASNNYDQSNLWSLESHLNRAQSLPSSPNFSRRSRSHRATSTRRAGSPRLLDSPIEFKSPASASSKIEDGLKVCSIEHFEKHIGNIKLNQIEVQKRIFKAWINHFCPNLIQHDLVEELRDGIKLIGLLGTLARDRQLLIQYQQLKLDKQSLINRIVHTPSSRIKQLSNVSIAIDYLRRNLGMKLINLNAMDIVEGRANVTLGLCWNIILNFQLEQNFLRNLESSADAKTRLNLLDSQNQDKRYKFKNYSEIPLSGNSNQEEEGRRSKRSEKQDFFCENSSNDVINIRRKLLEHINQRFNLKLTSLTSNLLDGDVLFSIIKQLIPRETSRAFKLPKNGDNNSKLNYCFDLAQEHLKVPKLFSASDFELQFYDSENCSKPMLVYLSMLLSASNDFKCEPSNQAPAGQSMDADINSIIESKLNEIDVDEKFQVYRYKSTMLTLKELEQLIEGEGAERVDESLAKRVAKLRLQVDQIEQVISWLNKADEMFDLKLKSRTELICAMEEYERFFSSQNQIQLPEFICPTLKRQFRECLANANQIQMTMEQTLKNWANYEESKMRLKDWLSEAERKLTVNLFGGRPTETDEGVSRDHPEKSDFVQEVGFENRLEIDESRIEELIRFFELEPNSAELFDGKRESSASFGRFDELESSFGGSVLSLASNSSRISTLQLARGATYTNLFEDFELKCRLLMASLDSEQRQAISIVLSDVRRSLKYIIEQRVPEVLGELRMSIERCKLFVQTDRVEPIRPGEQLQAIEDAEKEEEQDDGLLLLSSSPSSPIESCSEIEHRARINDESPVVALSGDRAAGPKGINSNQSESKGKNSSFSGGGQTKIKTPEKQKTKPVASNNKSSPKQRKPRAQAHATNNKKAPSKKLDSSSKTARHKSNDNDDHIPISTLVWRKIVRAYKASIPLNIILLICLTGICVLPLMNREACCELTKDYIPPKNSE